MNKEVNALADLDKENKEAQETSTEAQKDAAAGRKKPEEEKEEPPEAKEEKAEKPDEKQTESEAEEKKAEQADAQEAEEIEEKASEDKSEPEKKEENAGTESKEDQKTQEAEKEKKTSRFARKEKKKDKKDQQIEELNDRLVRLMAEFDNYRKRTDREKSQMFDSGASDVLVKILPVMDDMQRGFEGLSEEEKETSFAKGMSLIYKKLQSILTDMGVKEIETVGKEFDPNLHNAVMQKPSEEYESGVVIQELQKGYTYKDCVLRHSMVVVAE